MTGKNMEQKEQLKEILPCYMLVVQLFKERLGYVNLRSTLTLDNLNQLVRDCRLNTHSKEPPYNRAFKVKKRTPKEAIRTGWRGPRLGVALVLELLVLKIFPRLGVGAWRLGMIGLILDTELGCLGMDVGA
ncbi:hypothetical protein PIB30_091966 [Stylosanthes scabra]|uniref:Uncharacterized protein n=1 Tax=Stylosanthes scabra TaxID=79078 RepID=A0ABU6VUM0_9FABA|nr:hypothetical protein [Stylosanthes scabra]